MLNFCLLSAARDMVTDNDSSTTCRIKVKAPSLKTNTKNERLPKTWVPSNNSLKILEQKNQKFQSCHGEQNKGNTTTQMQKLNMDHVTRKKKTEANLKKALIKIVGTLQD